MSTWTFELRAVSPDDAVAKRAAVEIVAVLSKHRRVEADGSAWCITYAEFGTRADALKTLEDNLDLIDWEWREVLTIGQASNG